MVEIRVDPILLRLGTFGIGWHGVMLALGLLLGYLIFLDQGRRRGVAADSLHGLAYRLVLFGYVGARLLHVAQHWPEFAGNPARILYVHQGGFSIYGGVIIGVFVALLYSARKRLPFWSLADAAAVAVLAGEIVGRIGCTLNGDVHGIPTGGNWGFIYWHPDALVPFALRGVPLYPIPLMYQVWLLGIAFVLALLYRRQAIPGIMFLVYLIGYALGRAVISLWLPESKPGSILNSTQIVSLAVVALSLALLLHLRASARAGRRREVT